MKKPTKRKLFVDGFCVLNNRLNDSIKFMYVALLIGVEHVSKYTSRISERCAKPFSSGASSPSSFRSRSNPNERPLQSIVCAVRIHTYTSGRKIRMRAPVGWLDRGRGVLVAGVMCMLLERELIRAHLSVIGWQGSGSGEQCTSKRRGKKRAEENGRERE